ncbi:MAG: PIN domain-containing protein [Myxococcota bacterium]
MSSAGEFYEELAGRHAHLLEHGLKLIPLGERAMLRAVEFASRYRRPSRLDLAALAAAEQQGCPLITGDKNLRAAAESERIAVYGTLWLMERLVITQIISVAQARVAYARMRDLGRRLPWDEAESRLRSLSR